MTISIPGSTVATILNRRNETESMITGPDVYQPLKETSAAIDVVREQLGKLSSTAGLRLADLGSGTGQLAIWSKQTFPDLEVHTYDIDPNTEKYVKANAELYNVDVTVHIMDVAAIPNTEKFDVVISCPPFFPEIIKKIEYHHTHWEDPDIAVYGGFKGMEVQAIFLEKAANILKKDGFIVVVHSPAQRQDINTLLSNNGFRDIDTRIINTGEVLDVVDGVFTLAYKN